MTTATLWLALTWLALGVLVGALATAARLDGVGDAESAQRPLVSRAWAKIAIGALAGLLGGWLGVVVFGRLYSVATALWVSALCAVALPWLAQRGWRRAPKADEGDAL